MTDNWLGPRHVSEPPDGGVGWAAVVAGFCIWVVTSGLQYVIGIFFKAWMARPAFAGLSTTALAWSTSIETACFLAGSLLVGVLVRRLGTRLTLVGCAGVLLLGTFVVGFTVRDDRGSTVNLALLYIFFSVCVGSACSIATITALVSVQQYFKSRRGLASGLTVAGSGFGSFTLGPLMEYLVQHRGWEYAMVVYGALAASVCVLASLAFIPMVIVPAAVPAPAPAAAAPVIDKSAEATASTDTAVDVELKEEVILSVVGAAHSSPCAADDPRPGPPSQSTTAAGSEAHGVRQDGHTPVGMASTEIELPSKGSDKHIEARGVVVVSEPGKSPPWPPAQPAPAPHTYATALRTRFFVTFAAYVACNGMSFFTVPTYLPIFITAGAGGTSADVSAVLSIQGACNTLGRVLVGLLADAFPRQKLMILSVSAACICAATTALALTSALGYLYAYGAILGLLGGATISLMPGIIIDEVGMSAVTILQGAFNGAQTPFALAGPPIGGALKAATGTYAGTWAFVATGMGLSFLLSLNIGQGGAWIRRRTSG